MKNIRFLVLAFVLVLACDSSESTMPAPTDDHNGTLTGASDCKADGTCATEALEPVSATLYIESFPTNASVMLDGVLIDEITDCNLSTTTGKHEIELDLPGRMQWPPVLEVDIRPPDDGEENRKSVQLYCDLSGNWKRLSDGSVDEWEMLTEEVPDAHCPDGGLQVFGPTGITRLCMEPNDQVSAFKTGAQGVDPVSGTITADCRKVQLYNFKGEKGNSYIKLSN